MDPILFICYRKPVTHLNLEHLANLFNSVEEIPLLLFTFRFLILLVKLNGFVSFSNHNSTFMHEKLFVSIVRHLYLALHYSLLVRQLCVIMVHFDVKIVSSSKEDYDVVVYSVH